MPADTPEKARNSPKLSGRATATLAVTAACVGAATVAGVLLAPEAARSEALVKILNVFVSWPFVVGLLGVTFGFTFREQIGEYISKAKIKFPGGTEIHALQAITPPELTTGAVVEAVAVQAQVNEELEKLRATLDTTSKNIEDKDLKIRELSAGLAVKNRIIGYWKARYLDAFLASRTKDVIVWFANAEPLTEKAFHELWTPYISDATQRTNILSALLTEKLLEQRGPMFQISEIGRTYLEAGAAWKTLNVAPEGKHTAAQSSWFDALERLGETGV